MTYDSYAAFVEGVVLPKRAANPNDRRLDGEESGGNWAVAGIFQHEGRRWKVHEDSHYEPLLIAYDAVRRGDPSPFVLEPTARGVCLNLKPELRRAMTNQRHKYLYVYSV